MPHVISIGIGRLAQACFSAYPVQPAGEFGVLHDVPPSYARNAPRYWLGLFGIGRAVG